MCRQDDLYKPGTPIRQLLIKAACLDVRRYFRPPGEIVVNRRQRHVSELDRLCRFRRRALIADDLRRFSRIYRVDQYMRWNFDCLASVVFDWPEECLDEQLFTDRVGRLMTCNKDRKRTVSAASKLNFFANPTQSAFIWDSLSRIAIECRYPLRCPPRPKGYNDREVMEYFDAARRCLEDEFKKEDFICALGDITPLLNPVRRSVFNDNEAATRNFAARRLLDKLLYYEGSLIDILNGKWVRDLERDVSAVDQKRLGQRELQAAE